MGYGVIQLCRLSFHAALQPKWRTVSGAFVRYILWVRGFRDHTIFGRGFNLFKPLRRHFRATPFLPSGPCAAIPTTETPRFKRSAMGSAISAVRKSHFQILVLQIALKRRRPIRASSMVLKNTIALISFFRKKNGTAVSKENRAGGLA